MSIENITTNEISAQTGEEIFPAPIPSAFEANQPHPEYKSEADILSESLNRAVEENNFLKAQVANLEATVQTLRDDIQRKRMDHIHDIDLIGETLLEKARQYDWCTAYDTAINEINSNLNIQLPPRIKEFVVTGTVSFPFTARVELEGTASESDAEAYIEDYSHNDLNIDFYSRTIDIDSVEED